MAIHLTTEAQLDLVQLQNRIHEQEEQVVTRLTSLVGKKENGIAFNAHDYELVADNTTPYSTLFVVSGAGGAASNPIIQTWLANHPGERIVCENSVYVSGSPTNIAVVR
jgi:D-ribose pyranose/furanose isomerase RbsD